MSKNLTFKLILDGESKGLVNAAKQSQEVTQKLFDSIKKEADQVRGSTNEAAKGIDDVGKKTTVAAGSVKYFGENLKSANSDLGKTETFTNQVTTSLNGLKTTLTAVAAAAAALGVGLGVRELAQAADSYTNLSARINIATKDGGNFTSAMAGVHQVALMTNSSLTATGDLFTRLNTVGKDMGVTQQQALDLTKTVTQAIQVGGGSAQASEAAITQFIQAMQGGVLRGEEFNSIMENGYGLAEALAKGLGVTTGELRKMAEAGELTASRVVRAIGSQSNEIQKLYNQFPTTISNALQRIGTSWDILIGKMDQANGASATVADWLVTLADNIYVVENILNDLGEGFVWVGDQLKKIDPQTIEALKSTLVTAYEAIKQLGATMGETFVVTLDLLNDALGVVLNFGNGVDEATSKTNGFTKVVQVLNVALGFVSDGFTSIGIAVNLFVGMLYDLSAAWVNLVSKFSWGDVKTQAIADMETLATKAQEYYDRASKGAMDFQSKGMAAYSEISKTAEQKNTERLADAQITMNQLLALSQTEVSAKQTNENEKLKAVQAYAEAAIQANGGVIDGVMQADLMTKGYIVTMDQAGKVSVEAWQKNTDAATGTANATDQARKGAATLGVDLDNALNQLSEKFKANATSLNDFSLGMENLGLKGEAATNALYLGWQKWLAGAKNQAELDATKAKLQEFGTTGQLSAQQVEMGLQAVKRAALELPDSISPVEAAFERLGIKTKEQLKLSAEFAMNDFNTIMKSGEATQDGLQRAYEETIRLAYASGDAQVIAAANAKAAYLGLEVQLDATGKATVTKLGEMQQAAVQTQRVLQQASKPVESSSSNNQDETDPMDALRKKMSERVAKSNAAAQARRGGSSPNISTPSIAVPDAAVPEAPMIASSFDIKAVSEIQPTETKRLELVSGNSVAQLNGSPEAVDTVEEMMRQFETIKRST